MNDAFIHASSMERTMRIRLKQNPLLVPVCMLLLCLFSTLVGRAQALVSAKEKAKLFQQAAWRGTVKYTRASISGESHGRYVGDSLHDAMIWEATRSRSKAGEDTDVRSTPLEVQSTFVVTSNLDTGPSTLRLAIAQANSNPGLDMITFNIPGGGIKTISPTSPLPAIIDPVIIDGTSQLSGTPLIELSGNLAGTSSNGLAITGGNCVIRGLIINRFQGNGVQISGGSGNRIEGNYIGTDQTGTTSLPNTICGVAIFGASGNNTIGGTTPATRNIISGNILNGVQISVGSAGGNRVSGNYIGLNAAGTAVLRNSASGVYIDAPNDTVGGLVAGERNVISGNVSQGIFIGPSGSGTRVLGNYVGTNSTGDIALGNLLIGIVIKSPNNTIGGSVPEARNVISGHGFFGVDIEGVAGNRVLGNYIGTNAGGTSRLPNLLGISVYSASGNIIGGPSAGERNIISGNLSHGVQIAAGGVGNVVAGNYIGLNAAGTDTIRNGEVGIFVDAPNNIIGGLSPGAGNIIAGNLEGIFINDNGSGNIVQANYIGTDATGMTPLGNLDAGIVVDNAPNNTIGGSTDAARNVISGNLIFGVIVQNTASTGNQVTGNYLGTSAQGITALPNLAGISVYDSPRNNIKNNVISGNAQFGIIVNTRGSTETRIEDNLIGPDAQGNNLGNGWHGVMMFSSQNTVQRNTIASNNGSGVWVEPAGTQNLITQNSTFANGGMGIDLAPWGLAKNDPLDVDTGPNDLQNFPILDSTRVVGSQLVVHGSLNSKPDEQFTIDFYSNSTYDPSHFGEGETWEQSLAVTTDPSGSREFVVSIPIPTLGDIPRYITATATDARNNTSEFSQALCTSDADSDGILDSWETQGWGIDVNSDGIIDQDLYQQGARPDHKDIFVEVDAMVGMAPQTGTLDAVVGSFATKPDLLVSNPDGSNGIKLHYLMDETDIDSVRWPPPADPWVKFDAVKSSHFGTVAENADPNKAFILEAKKLVYRYCLFAHSIGGPSGTTENSPFFLGGNDFMVTLGVGFLPPGGTEEKKAATFMHELGHSLGLKHGGNDNVNYKPNYLSIMNYAWQFRYNFNRGFGWELNYSNSMLDTLDEMSLNENSGLNPQPASRVALVPFSDASRTLRYAWLAPFLPVDWNGNGINDGAPVAVDVNGFDTRFALDGQTKLSSQSDWDKLIYNFRNSPHFSDGPTAAVQGTGEEEMDSETFDFLNNLPPPKPSGEFVMDGQLDTSAVLIATNAGINLYARYKFGQLYVATSSAQSQAADMFIFISDARNPLRAAPLGKTGQAAAWTTFLHNKSTDNSSEWYTETETTFNDIAVDTAGTVLEGVIYIPLLYGLDPANLFIAVGKYGANPGGTLLAQVPLGNGDGNIDPEELLFLTRSQTLGTPFIQQGNKLVGSGAVYFSATGVHQGQSVDLSADGNFAIVGGPNDNGNDGAAWVFARNGGVWSQQGNKLVGSGADGPNAHQGFSAALSSDGTTAIVGGIFGSSRGASWIFTRTGSVWSQQGNKLVGSDSLESGEQGHSVSLSSDGNTAIVGGPSGIGAAWIFTRTNGVWSQQGNKLIGTGAVNTPALQGASVSLSADGNTALVGGPGDGASWVFVRANGAWTQQGSKLVGSGAVNAANQGFSVALSGDGKTAIIGGPEDDASTGAAWIFIREGGVWSQQGSKLIATGAVGNASQGYSVSLSSDGNTAIVGGFRDSSSTGAAWIFVRSGNVWSQQGSKLVGTGAVNTPIPAYQGSAVALSSDGNTAIIGGPNDNQSRGAVWIFAREDQPLPIQLSSFTATVVNGNNVRLDWTTISETNNYGFEIQKKSEAQQEFQTLPNIFIAGHGTTTEPQQYTFTDSSANLGRWFYRLKQIDLDGTVQYTGGVVIDILTGVSQKLLPDEFALGQNYPDPFNPSTTIQYQLPIPARVTLRVYNILGQVVTTLVDEVQDAGYKSVVWNAGNVASGVYFYRLQTAGFTQTHKMLLTR